MEDEYRCKHMNVDLKLQTSVLNALPIGIGVYEVHDRKVEQIFLNNGFYRIMNDEKRLRDIRKNGSFMNAIHPDDREKVTDSIINVINGFNDASTVACRILTGIDQYKWIRYSSTVVKREGTDVLVYSIYIDIEEEMDSRKALEESQAVLEQSIKIADMSVWEYDCINRCIIQKNNSVEKHGFAKIVPNVPNSLVSSGFVHKVSADSFMRMYNELFDKKKTVQGDFYVQNGERTGYWWEHIILTPIFDNSGRMIKALGTSLDVTERKVKEERYYGLIGTMSESDDSDLIEKGQYNITSKRFEYYVVMRKDGLSLEMDDSFGNVLMKALPHIISEEKRREAARIFNVDYLLAEHAAGRNEGIFEYRRTFGDSPIVYAMLKYLMCTDPVTGDVMLFVYCIDNSARKIEQIFVDNMSESEYETFGFIDVGTGDFSQKHLKLMDVYESFVSGHDYYSESMRIIHKYVVSSDQGELKTNLRMKNILSRLECEPIYMFSYSVKVHDEIRRKKITFKYADTSKNTILYTSSDITKLYIQEQKHLIKTQKALETARKATKAKSEFLSRMSHDIRTPLNAILGSAALARADIQNTDAVLSYLDNIGSAGHFLLGLINDILDINKIESGKLELRNSTCRLSDFAEEVVRSVRPMMDMKHIDFVFQMDCGYETIYVDAARYHQIFTNLLSNAAKYTPEHGRVEFITERIPAEYGIAGIRNYVRDNGIGMSSGYMKHMFEPFTRDDNVEINKIEGSGLGLAIVKNIVDSMGGSISVKSEPGKGTEFIVDIYVPVRDGLADDDEYIINESLLKGLNVLIVEDNDINVGIFKRLLELKGCIVAVAEDGRAAVDYFAASHEYSIDAVLMDIRMPVMNGLEATRTIRAMKREDAASVPIIAMTADAYADDVNRTRAAGMNEHLSKPVDPDRLYSVILKYCS